jgi:hypothetical protein
MARAMRVRSPRPRRHRVSALSLECPLFFSGFKSVFKISTTPRVHSREYHFQFDSTGDGLGYIVPTPIAPPPSWDAGGGTAIVLPLEPSSAHDTLRGFRVHMADVCARGPEPLAMSSLGRRS